jgi:ABC-type transport system involved in cytochrome c biogenesis permease subunit
MNNPLVQTTGRLSNLRRFLTIFLYYIVIAFVWLSILLAVKEGKSGSIFELTSFLQEQSLYLGLFLLMFFLSFTFFYFIFWLSTRKKPLAARFTALNTIVFLIIFPAFVCIILIMTSLRGACACG